MDYIDIGQDDGLEILKVAMMGATPEMMEVASETDLNMDYDELIKEAFADQENRQFPIHSPGDTLISAMYINAQEGIPSLVKEACAQQLSDFGIDYSFDVIEKVAKMEPSPSETFLLVDRKKLPATTPDMLIKSASHLDGSFESLTLKEKVESSTQLFKFALDFGMDTQELDSKFKVYSMESGVNLTKLSMSVQERMGSVDQEGQNLYRPFLEKTAAHIQNTGNIYSFDKEINIGIAHELLELDKHAGLFGTYDAIYDTFNAPEMAEEVMDKTANANTETYDMGGSLVPLTKIASFDEDSILRIIGPSGMEVMSDGAIDLDKLDVFRDSLTKEAQVAIGHLLSNN